MLDPSSLFEEILPPEAVGDEIDQVAMSKKPVSLHGFPIESIIDCDDDSHEGYCHIVSRVLDKQLWMVHVPSVHMINDRAEVYVDVFVTTREHVWRAAALSALEAAFRGQGWSDGAEILRSTLLGYDSASTARWMAYQRHTRAGWGVATIYFLLNAAQRELLKAVGCRCMLPSVMESGIVKIIFPRGRLALRRDISLGSEQCIARAGIDWRVVDDIFSTSHRNAIECITLEHDKVAVLNAGLRTNLEFWTDGGWK